MASRQTGPDYAQIREGIQAKYRDILAARKWLQTDGQRILDASGPLKPAIVPVWRLLEQTLRACAKRLEDFEDIEFDFPDLADRDADKWTEIQKEAREFINRATDLAKEGQLEVMRNLGRGADLPRGGPVYPNRLGTAYGWGGISGANYRSQIPRQIEAAVRIETFAIRAGGFIKGAGIDFRFLMLNLWNFLVAVFKASVALIAAAIAVASSVASLGTSLLAAAGAIAYAIYQYWADVGPAITNYDTMRKALWAGNRPPAKTLNDMYGEQNPAFTPGNKWPDPTVDAEFPHMTRGRDGQWKISTNRVFD